MDILERMDIEGHEQLALFSDPAVGLKAIIAIHDTTLGPACGGTRLWPYPTEQQAVQDVLRLSRAMTYKSAAADLPLGGGKAVIIADARADKNEALLRAYGRCVDSLGGRYITTTDVGTTGRDLEYIRQETPHVVGLPTSTGGSGDTSIMTGLGIYMGMKACAKAAWGSDSLTGKTIAMQGFGKVATQAAHHLMKEDARLIVTDVFQEALDRAAGFGLETAPPEDFHTLECDIFSPNALGGTLNPETIPQLRCRVVAGGANNQLLNETDGAELNRRGILYAPDYIINSGGVINVEAEIGAPYSAERAREKTERIYEIIANVIHIAQRAEIPTAQAADRLAEERLAAVRRLRPTYRRR